MGNARRSVLALLLSTGSAFLPHMVQADDSGCAVLVDYRDTQLVADWSVFLRKRRGVVEAQADVQELKDNLNSSNWWTLSSVPDIALAVKTTANLVQGVVESAVPSAHIVGSLSRSSVSRRVYEGLKRGENIRQLVTEEFGELAWSLLAEKAGRVGAAADTIKTTADNLRRMESLGGEKDSYRQTLIEQSARLDQELARYAAKLAILIDQQDQLNGIREAIDQRCSGNEDGSLRLPLATPVEQSAEPLIPASAPQSKLLPIDLEAVYQKCKALMDDDPSGSTTRACVESELQR